MTRTQLEQFLQTTYCEQPEYLWIRYPTFAVFRHQSNKKWFAVVMTINKRKLGIDQDGEIDVVNVKCDQELIPFLHGQSGIYPAYHMSKSHWITLALDGSITEDNVKFFVDISFNLTATQVKNKHIDTTQN